VRSPLKRFIPLLIIGAVGVWIWKGGSGLFPADHQLIWQIPGEWRTVRAVEIQIWDEDELLKREELSFPRGLTGDITQKLSLKQGSYRARVFVRREDQPNSISWSWPVRIGGDESVLIALPEQRR
jgi:hypothetical protein